MNEPDDAARTDTAGAPVPAEPHAPATGPQAGLDAEVELIAQAQLEPGAQAQVVLGSGADGNRTPVVPDRFDVFLSHNGRDKPSVQRLAEKLRRAGLRPWLDAWDLTPGGRWQDELHTGLQASRACAYFIGPNGEGDWAREELDAARSRAANDREFRLFPVLLPGCGDPFDRTTLPPFLGGRTWVDFRAGLEDSGALQALINATKGIPLGPTTGDGDRSADVCPYRGLRAFDEDDARFFFGRDADIQQLLEKLKVQRFLAVMGPSGSGKSSLVRAGLVPALRRGALPGSEAWTVSVFKPGGRPLEAVAARLLSLGAPAGMGETVDHLASDARTLHLASALVLGDDGAKRCVWVVDQAEEMFTLCRDERERQAFIDNLTYAASVPGGRCVIVLAMRADFYARCATHPDLAALIATSQYLVGPMTPDGIRDAIEEPARQVGLEFEQGLVGTILGDIERQPGALPLLEHALLELWERRRGRMLTLEGYREAGGVQGAIAKRAESIYEHFDPEEQEIARRALLRLTQPGEGTEDTRRRAALSELITHADEKARVEAVVNELTDARLLTTSADEHTGESWVDISHEALIRGWPRVRQWLDEDRTSLLVHRRLTEAAQEWERLERDDSELYHGARLAEAQEWRTDHDDLLNDQERAFLDASGAAAERARRASERARRRLTLIATGLAAVFLVLAAAAGWQWATAEDQRRQADSARQAADQAAQTADAERQTADAERQTADAARRDADQQRNLAVAAAQLAGSRLLAAQALNNEPFIDRALLLSAQANLRSNAVDVRGSLLHELTVEPALEGFIGDLGAPVDSVAISRDGKNVGWAAGGTVRLAPLATPSHVTLTYASGLDAPTMIAIDPISAHVAVAGGGRLRSVTTSDGSVAWDVAVGSVQHLAYVGTGAQVAAALRDGSVELFDAASGRLLSTAVAAPPASGSQLAPPPAVSTFSADGLVYARVQVDGSVVAWNLGTGQPIGEPNRPPPGVRDLALGPGGTSLAVLHSQGVGWYTVGQATGVSTIPLEGTSGGQRLAWTNSPPGIALIDPAAGIHWLGLSELSGSTLSLSLAKVDGRPDGVDLAVAPDGHTLAVGFADGRVGLWDLGEHWPLAARLANAPQLPVAASSPASFGPVALARDPSVSAWYDAANARIVVHDPAAGADRFLPEAAAPQALAVDSSGSRVITVENAAPAPNLVIRAAADGSVQLTAPLPNVGSQSATAVGVSPDGTSVAVAMGDGRVLCIATDTGKTRWTFQDPDVSHVTAVAYEWDGATLDVGAGPKTAGDGAVILRVNASTGTVTAGPWSVDAPQITAIAPDPGGQLLVVAAGGAGSRPAQQLIAIDPQHPSRPLGSLGPPSDRFAAIGFTTDGHSLVSVGASSGWLTWGAGVNVWLGRACSLANRDLSTQEWTDAVGSEAYRSTCSALPAATQP